MGAGTQEGIPANLKGAETRSPSLAFCSSCHVQLLALMTDSKTLISISSAVGGVDFSLSAHSPQAVGPLLFLLFSLFSCKASSDFPSPLSLQAHGFTRELEHSNLLTEQPKGWAEQASDQLC